MIIKFKVSKCEAKRPAGLEDRRGNGSLEAAGIESAAIGTNAAVLEGASSEGLPPSEKQGSNDMGKFDLYQEITDQVIEKIEAGTVPWHRTWSASGMPKNLKSGKTYRGINVFLLGFQVQFGNPYWVTFRQAKELGGAVKAGEKSSIVVFWKRWEKETGEYDLEGDPVIESIPVLRYYRVFNIDQTEGLECPAPARETERVFSPVAAGEKIVEDMPNRPKIERNSRKPSYCPATDTVYLPAGGKFEEPGQYYTAAFHELTHSTGHKSRLNRKMELPGQVAAMGDSDYGREELVAEMGAAFLAGTAGLTLATIDDNAAYLAGWLELLRRPKNKKLLVTAAAQAQKAADYILGRVFG